MTSYKSICAAIAAVMLLAACAKNEQAAPEAAAEAAPEPAPVEVAPATDANSADGEQSGGDKVSDPEPPPAGG